MKDTPENRVKQEVRDYLKISGWFVFPILQGLGSYRGIPDLIAIKNGNVLFIECKSENGRLSKYQKKFKDDVINHGGNYIIATNFEDVRDYIEAIL